MPARARTRGSVRRRRVRARESVHRSRSRPVRAAPRSSASRRECSRARERPIGAKAQVGERHGMHERGIGQRVIERSRASTASAVCERGAQRSKAFGARGRRRMQRRVLPQHRGLQHERRTRKHPHARCAPLGDRAAQRHASGDAQQRKRRQAHVVVTAGVRAPERAGDQRRDQQRIERHELTRTPAPPQVEQGAQATAPASTRADRCRRSSRAAATRAAGRQAVAACNGRTTRSLRHRARPSRRAQRAKPTATARACCRGACEQQRA